MCEVSGGRVGEVVLSEYSDSYCLCLGQGWKEVTKEEENTGQEKSAGSVSSTGSAKKGMLILAAQEGD